MVRRGETNASGLATFRGLNIGGPYTVTAGAGGLGYRPDSRTGIRLTLGQRLDLDFTLATEAIQVEGITATVAASDQIINPSRTGQQTLVTENLIENTPSIGRNFTDFIDYSPLSGTGGGATPGAPTTARGTVRFRF